MITDPNGIYIDCTLGGGGHFRGILENTGPGARIIGIDRDGKVLAETRGLFRDDTHRDLAFVHSNFDHLPEVLEEQGIELADGIVMDLGVSSFQLDEEKRGFSYQHDAPLDMRMDDSQELSAWQVVNLWDQETLAGIIRDYGEEKMSGRIARSIVYEREKHSIDTTGQLAQIIRRSMPKGIDWDKHPARRTFQALRIAVNDELGALKRVLPRAIGALKPGGRLCVITFHSLEDRIVKETMQTEARSCICPPKQPICTCNHCARIRLITRKPIIPGEDELENNYRARSAKLRVAEKV